MRLIESLARHMNMTRAAEELHMTPSAFSVQVKQLSETLGLPLHEQAGKKLFLTEAGHAAAAASRDMLQRLDLLGMELAESAARHAQRTLAEPEPDPAAVALSDPQAEAPDGPLPTELPRKLLRDPVKWFDRLARTVNACIKLQTQIIHQQSAATRPTADPRRPILRRALRPFIHTVPDEPPFPPGPSLQEIDDAVDQELQADPDRLTPLTEILTLVCEDLGLNPEIIPLPPPEPPRPRRTP